MRLFLFIEVVINLSKLELVLDHYVIYNLIKLIIGVKTHLSIKFEILIISILFFENDFEVSYPASNSPDITYG